MSEADQASPPVGWAVGRGRPCRAPHPRRERQLFVAGLGVLNALFATALGFGLFGPGAQPQTRAVVVTTIFWCGVAANLLYLAGAWMIRRVARTRRFAGEA